MKNINCIRSRCIFAKNVTCLKHIQWHPVNHQSYKNDMPYVCIILPGVASKQWQSELHNTCKQVAHSYVCHWHQRSIRSNFLKYQNFSHSLVHTHFTRSAILLWVVGLANFLCIFWTLVNYFYYIVHIY